MNAGSDWPRELPQASRERSKKQWLAETILEARKDLIKADGKNIRLC